MHDVPATPQKEKLASCVVMHDAHIIPVSKEKEKKT
jgi:hypothetical protein